jgi:23S rRNA (pseudouridine1915-N3)-methyltransferase
MLVHLIAVGERMPEWVEAGFREYARRLKPPWRLQLREVPAGRRTKGADIARVMREEGVRLLAAVPPGCRLVALDREGRTMDTEGFVARLKEFAARGETLALLVGGPEGLSPECRARAEEVWSLSKLTLAHALVRVVVAEQVYRAYSIVQGLPYHR